MLRRPFLPLLAVFGAWATAVALVGIHGEFPLNDDWAYGHVVRSLLDGRGFDFLPWTGATLVAQAVYGSLLCAATGFSWETLRWGSMLLSVAGVVAFHALLRGLGTPPRQAAWSAAALAFCPLWFHLAFPFLTDLPFASLAVMATAATAAGIRRDARVHLLAGSLLAAAAFLVRQHGVWIPAAAALVLLLPRRDAERSVASRAVDLAAVLAVPCLVAAAWAAWALHSPAAPLAVHNKMAEATAASPWAVANAAYRGIATLGLLLLPWSAGLGRPTAAEKRWGLAAFSLLAAAAVFLWRREGALMFYLPNLLGDSFIGAWTTRDALFLGRPPGPEAGVAWHALLTVACLASAARVGGRLAAASPSLRDGTDAARARSFVFAALLLSALGSLLQAHYYFDRYLLVLVPLAAAALAATPRGLGTGRAFAAPALLLGVWGVAGTHDYMQWNRARWHLLQGLEARGVDARRIDGGMEYNGDRLAAVLGTAPTDADARRGQPASRKSWWWVVDDEFVIAFSDLEGYSIMEEREWTRWLPPGPGRVLLLQRKPVG